MGMILWLCFFLAVVVLTYLPYKGRDFKNIIWRKVVVLSTLFLFSSSMLLVIVWPELNVRTSLVIMIPFSAITLSWFLAPKFVRSFGKYPKAYLEKKVNDMRFLPKVESKTTTIKYFEVLFQQAGFLFLFFKVLDGFPLNERILLFTTIVATFHLGNILFMHAKWTLFYFVLSIPMGFAFGYLLSQGLIFLTVSIHLLFYIIFNTRYWFTAGSS
jgi:hypothetical protein